MPKIIIMGCGIGGLTVAHDLISINLDYEIHLYERHDKIGGMARSGVKNRGGTILPTEYCWRIYGPNYRACCCSTSWRGGCHHYPGCLDEAKYASVMP